MSQKYPCTEARPTKTCVGPVDASGDFIYFLRTSSVGGGGGGVCSQTFSFVLFSLFSRPRVGLAIVLSSFFGLATNNTLNVRNNNNNINSILLLRCLMAYDIISVLFLLFFWCPCMAINNVSVQHNGGLLPDIILLTQCGPHRGTRLNATKKFCFSSLRSHLNVLTFPPP